MAADDDASRARAWVDETFPFFPEPTFVEHTFGAKGEEVAQPRARAGDDGDLFALAAAREHLSLSEAVTLRKRAAHVWACQRCGRPAGTVDEPLFGISGVEPLTCRACHPLAHPDRRGG